MTREDKDLLLKDLCARLPYVVKCRFHSKDGDIFATIIGIKEDYIDCIPDGQSIAYIQFIKDVRPYLRPMSSMTDEERTHFYSLDDEVSINKLIDEWIGMVDWLNAHHFDRRGLIKKGLALKAPKDMYKGE